MTVQDFAVSGTFTVPAGVTSLWLEVWGDYGGDGVYWNGGYAEADYACTPGEDFGVVINQYLDDAGIDVSSNSGIYITAGYLVIAGSGWDNGVDNGGPGIGWFSPTYTTGGSATTGTNTGVSKARITYTAVGGGPTPFVGWGVPL